MLNLTDFNGKEVALPLPSFESAALDALTFPRSENIVDGVLLA